MDFLVPNGRKIVDIKTMNENLKFFLKKCFKKISSEILIHVCIYMCVFFLDLVFSWYSFHSFVFLV